jgi:hypothetical protein
MIVIGRFKKHLKILNIHLKNLYYYWKRFHLEWSLARLGGDG